MTQFILMAAIIAAGVVPPDWPDGVRRCSDRDWSRGGDRRRAFAVWAARSLGRSLTPFPKPLGTGLVTNGPFAIVRHPIYTGGLAFFAGYALFAGVPALVLTAARLGRVRLLGRTKHADARVERLLRAPTTE